jgi:hypothetical protein
LGSPIELFFWKLFRDDINRIFFYINIVISVFAF